MRWDHHSRCDGHYEANGGNVGDRGDKEDQRALSAPTGKSRASMICLSVSDGVDGSFGPVDRTHVPANARAIQMEGSEPTHPAALDEYLDPRI